MQKTSRIGWLIMGITWGAILWLVVKHERLGLDYLTVLNQMAPPKNIAETAPIPGILPSQRTDAKMWVRHAITLDEQGGGRLRYTTFDNSPQGREVHWNSTWVWLLRQGGKVWQKLGNDSLTIPQAIAAWSYWQSLPVFLMGLVGISTWTTRRMGAGAGLFMAWGMLGSIPFSDAFFPGNSDHPGLIAAAGFGMVLGLVFAGAGWWQKSNNDAALLPASMPEARRAAGYSALCGALGMWLSAASTIPVISILGVSGFLMVLRKRGETTRLNFAPEVWRWWGRFGALGSLLAYLIEYFPHHLSWHMEVNHPVYALAWWGGAELVALTGEWRQGLAWSRWRLIPALLAAVAPLFVMAVAGAQYFSLLDPFMARVHDFINEYRPLTDRLKSANQLEGRSGVFATLFSFPVAQWLPLVAAAGTLWWKKLRAGESILLGFALRVALACTAMAAWQNHWRPNSIGPLLCLGMIVLHLALVHRHIALRWMAIAVVTGVLFLPPALDQIDDLQTMVERHTVARNNAMQPMYRDIARVIRRDQPTGGIVLLADPNASLAISYYGLFKTIGTFYWENTQGLKTAAAIFSTNNEAEAKTMIQARGITHVVMVSHSNFLSQYYIALNPTKSEADYQRSFGFRLMGDTPPPSWLQPINYAVPGELAGLETIVFVRLFKVIP